MTYSEHGDKTAHSFGAIVQVGHLQALRKLLNARHPRELVAPAHRGRSVSPDNPTCSVTPLCHDVDSSRPDEQGSILMDCM